MIKWLGKIFGKGSLESVADIVDRFVDTKEEKREFFKEVYDMHAKDRADARNMYSKNSLIQKIYAITFLVGYLGLTGWLLHSIITGSIAEINQFETGIIGSIWGAMSSKINTVVDFFFGASENRDVKKYDNLIKKDK